MAVRRSGNGALPGPAASKAPAAATRSPRSAPAATDPAPRAGQRGKPLPAAAGLTKSASSDGVSASHVTASRTPKQGRDVVLVTGPTEDGKGLSVLRAKDDTLQIGAVRPLEEGKPIHGEVVKLKQRGELPGLFDVESQFDAAAEGGTAPARRPATNRADSNARPTSAGPAQVATDTYRTGWDRIYRRSTKRELPN